MKQPNKQNEAMSFYHYHDEYESEYSGTYACNVAGYSADYIDNIFDRDPEAYWNIN